MPKPPAPRPTASELAILRVLWDRGPSTVREVQAKLDQVAPTGYTTVLKLLQIMTEKQLVLRDERQRAHVYSTREPRQQVQRGLVNDLLDRAFGGSASQLVQQALTSRPASESELQEIRQILDQMSADAASDSQDPANGEHS